MGRPIIRVMKHTDNPKGFQHVVHHMHYTVAIDLMTSRTNCQVGNFGSWRAPTLKPQLSMLSL